ncbi:MAG: LysR family transcriptional regulator [Methylobacteriaceae bacterium]|nr:LysR family transcriptional regulator [Methylobacteriaceae bacterium]
MTLVELRYIVALAIEGNFSRAAERCSVSQPTLSVAIARIEQELGVALFERAKGFVSPSPVGAEIVRQARIAIAEAEKIRDIARTGRDQLAGPLRLGVIHTVGPYLLPPLIVELKRIAPTMPLVIEENMTAALQEMLAANEIDAAIIALPFDPPGVATRALYDESFLVIVPHGHAWQGREAIDPGEMRGDEVLLLKAGNCFRDQVLGACPQVSKAETDIHLGYSIGTLRWMVASGLGVSILPASALQRPHASELVTVIPFSPPEPSRRIALAWRVGFTRPKALEALADAVRALDQPAFRHVEPAQRPPRIEAGGSGPASLHRQA